MSNKDHELRYGDSEQPVIMDALIFHETICGAVRYYMGRHTIAVHGFGEWLYENIMAMPSNTRFIVWRDIARWLADNNGEYSFAGVDDAEPFRKVMELCEEKDPEIKCSYDYLMIQKRRQENVLMNQESE